MTLYARGVGIDLVVNAVDVGQTGAADDQAVLILRGMIQAKPVLGLAEVLHSQSAVIKEILRHQALLKAQGLRLAAGQLTDKLVGNHPLPDIEVVDIKLQGAGPALARHGAQDKLAASVLRYVASEGNLAGAQHPDRQIIAVHLAARHAKAQLAVDRAARIYAQSHQVPLLVLQGRPSRLDRNLALQAVGTEGQITLIVKAQLVVVDQLAGGVKQIAAQEAGAAHCVYALLRLHLGRRAVCRLRRLPDQLPRLTQLGLGRSLVNQGFSDGVLMEQLPAPGLRRTRKGLRLQDKLLVAQDLAPDPASISGTSIVNQVVAVGLGIAGAAHLQGVLILLSVALAPFIAGGSDL